VAKKVWCVILKPDAGLPRSKRPLSGGVVSGTEARV
jgi:hypothetical protein